MREVGADEGEIRLSHLLEWVEAGEEVVITRDGKPLARLVPPSIDAERVREAVEGIRVMRKGATLGGSTIRELIDEGRR